MTVSAVTLDENRVRTGTITIPRVGTWVCDVTTDDEIAPTALVGLRTVTAGDLVLRGTVVRGEAWQGGTRARLVGGYAGWRRPIPARWYSIPAGVRPSLVAQDAATAAGEVIGAAPAADAPKGVLYARPAQVAARTLYDLGMPWYVLDAGTTSLAPWPAGRVGVVFDVTSYDAARGIVSVASDSLTAWRPLRVFASPRLPTGDFAISDVVHHIEPGRIRTDLWCTGRGA